MHMISRFCIVPACIEPPAGQFATARPEKTF